MFVWFLYYKMHWFLQFPCLQVHHFSAFQLAPSPDPSITDIVKAYVLNGFQLPHQFPWHCPSSPLHHPSSDHTSNTIVFLVYQSCAPTLVWQKDDSVVVVTKRCECLPLLHAYFGCTAETSRNFYLQLLRLMSAVVSVAAISSTSGIFLGVTTKFNPFARMFISAWVSCLSDKMFNPLVPILSVASSSLVWPLWTLSLYHCGF